MNNQIVQSLGQFLIVFFTGLATYKGWHEVVAIGVLDAVWQPTIQGMLAALGIWGFSKVGRQP